MGGNKGWALREAGPRKDVCAITESDEEAVTEVVVSFRAFLVFRPSAISSSSPPRFRDFVLPFELLTCLSLPSFPLT